jgi:SH3-like domain-containing protein
LKSNSAETEKSRVTFKLRGVPVKVISEYDNWNEIKDYDGETGWVNQNLLTKKRMAMIKTAKTFVNLHSAETEKSRVILRIENNVVAELIKCSGDWCGIKIEGKKGWVDRKELWGVDAKD